MSPNSSPIVRVVADRDDHGAGCAGPRLGAVPVRPTGLTAVPQATSTPLILHISCDECPEQATASCDDCVVTYLLAQSEAGHEPARHPSVADSIAGGSLSGGSMSGRSMFTSSPGLRVVSSDSSPESPVLLPAEARPVAFVRASVPRPSTGARVRRRVGHGSRVTAPSDGPGRTLGA